MKVVRYGHRNLKLISTLLLITIAFSTLPAETTEGLANEIFEYSLTELLELEITTAGRKEETIREIPASVVIITREEIKTHGYRNLQEILENVPGLFIHDDMSYTGPNLGVRGFWAPEAHNVIIMVNGQKQIVDLYSDILITKIRTPVEAIERIEIIRGPMSVIYGAGAFYGVINIITSQGSLPGSSSIVSVAGGSENTGKVFLRVNGSKNGFDYTLNGALFRTDGMNRNLSEMTSTVPGNIPPNTKDRLENRHLYMDFSANTDSFYFNFQYNNIEREMYFYYPSATDGYFQKLSHTRLRFGYRAEIFPGFRLDASYSFRDSRGYNRADYFVDDYFGVQKDISEGSAFELITYAKPAENAELTAGVSIDMITHCEYRIDHPFFYEQGANNLGNTYHFLPDDENIVLRAFFSQLDYYFSDKVKVVGGLRLEQMPKYEIEQWNAGGLENFSKKTGMYDEEDIAAIPRFAAIYMPDGYNSFKLLYGEAINRPSFYKNDGQLNDSLPTLEPEYIKTVEFNHIYSTCEGFSINTSLFYNELENLFTRMHYFDNEGAYHSIFTNAGKMTTIGLESTVNYLIATGLQVEISGIIQNTEDKMEGMKDIKPAYSPDILGYFKAHYNTKIINIPISFAINCSYVDEMESYWDNTPQNTQDPDSPPKGRIGPASDSYFLVGANFRADDIFVKDLYANLKISNITDCQVQYPLITINPVFDKYYLGSGRFITLSMGYNF